MKTALTKKFPALGIALLIFLGGILQDFAGATAYSYSPPGSLIGIAQSAASLPTFTVQPASQILSQNGTAYFSFTATGPGPFSYQWLSNGTPIPGATGDTLAVTNVTLPTNGVSNGSFETPFIGESNVTYLPYSAGNIVGGWTVESNSVELVGIFWQAADGMQSMELIGNTSGVIYQDVATVPGQQYYLHFAMAGDPGGGQAIKTNQVWWNGSLLDTVAFNTTNQSVTAMGWTNREYLVTATGTTTRVRFASVNTGNYGPALDQVILEAVPPPPANYSVSVSNAGGSVTSAIAQVQFDIDGNGLPDSWERMYFGSIGQNPNADSDGDGVSNGQEYLDGTDPTNPASFRPRINVLTTPGGLVTASPVQSSYTLNQPLQITAIPNPGNYFLYWTGSAAGTNPTVNLVATSNLVTTAVFGIGLPNGGNAAGTVTAGGTNFYAFTANTGDVISLRMGTVGFYGNLRLYGPNGVPLATNSNYYDDLITYTATNGGVFVVLVSANSTSASGTYALNLVQIPEPFIVPVGDEGGPMTNGGDYAGSITLGDQDMYSFTANQGDRINLRMGTSGFYGEIQLYGSNGVLLAANNDYYDDLISYTATNGGTFTVLVSSDTVDGAGTYVLNLAQIPEPFVVPTGDEGGPMTNGGNYSGTITIGDQDLYTFTANKGDYISVRMGTAGFYGELQLYAPNGALLAANNDYYDDQVTCTATNSGTFTVLVSSDSDDGAGTYTLNLAQIPESFIVPAGDDGGPMTNGGIYAGTIALGDQDMWTFTANKGDNFTLRLGSTGVYGNLQLFGPNGALLAANNNYYNSQINNYVATNSGTFTVLVSAANFGGSGTYVLSLAQLPEPFIVPTGDEGGPMTNGANYAGTITSEDQDLWTFTANAGDSINVRLGTTNFYGNLELYGPAGALLATATSSKDDLIVYTATNSGTFTVLVNSSDYGGLTTGTYGLNLAQIPESFVVPANDEGGSMTNGANYAGNITLGDQDLWTFPANKGDAINLRLGTTNFYGSLQLYGPNGMLLATATSSRDDLIAYTATNSGTFTVLVSSSDYSSLTTGTYGLNLAQIPEAFVVPPGDEGGLMTNGGNYAGTINLGEQDLWTFTANRGDAINLRLGTTNFYGSLQLYGPAGTQLATATSSKDNLISYTATNGGTFTVLVSSSDYSGLTTGTYGLNLSQIPEPFIVPAGDDGGAMINGANYAGTITLGDQDLWAFTANKGDAINVRLGTTNFYGNLQLYGPGGLLLATATSSKDDLISYTATNSGTFTVLVSSSDYSGLTTGTYGLNLAQVPEPFIVPTGDEGGPMTNGYAYGGNITLGDQDLWTFTACTGDQISLGLKSTNFNGNLQLYGLNGILLRTAQGSTTLNIAYTATNCGTFAVLVSSYNSGGIGTYQLTGTGLTGGLQFLSPTISGTNLYLSGSGGGSNLLFVIYAATNLAQPGSPWTPILTNRFDKTGAFSTTNLYDARQPQQYFRFILP